MNRVRNELRKWVLVCGVWLLALGVGQGQSALRDSLHKYFNEKPSLSVYFDGKNSFITSLPSKMFGLFAGVNYAGRLDIGLCIYNSYNEPLLPVYRFKGTPKADTTYRKLFLTYASARAEYIYYKTRHWEFSVPVSVGIGSGVIYDYDRQDSTYIQLKRTPNTLVPVEIGINGIYLIWRWLGISGGLSYRINLTHFEHFDELSTMNYTFGLSVRFGTLYKMAKSRLRKK